jgi:hypothetical protein
VGTNDVGFIDQVRLADLSEVTASQVSTSEFEQFVLGMIRSVRLGGSALSLTLLVSFSSLIAAHTSACTLAHAATTMSDCVET